MSKIIVCGALGRMGALTAQKIREAEDLELAALVDIAGDGENVLTSLEDFHGQAELIIDFSFHTAAPAIMGWAAARGIGVIMCLFYRQRVIKIDSFFLCFFTCEFRWVCF